MGWYWSDVYANLFDDYQKTILLVNYLSNFYVVCTIFRPDTLDPALLRPGRLDRKVEFGLPDLESRTQIFKIHTRTMNCERDIRFELLARLCPNSTGMSYIHTLLLPFLIICLSAIISLTCKLPQFDENRPCLAICQNLLEIYFCKLCHLL